MEKIKTLTEQRKSAHSEARLFIIVCQSQILSRNFESNQSCKLAAIAQRLRPGVTK